MLMLAGARGKSPLGGFSLKSLPSMTTGIPHLDALLRNRILHLERALEFF
jgi:hypothetical protein